MFMSDSSSYRGRSALLGDFSGLGLIVLAFLLLNLAAPGTVRADGGAPSLGVIASAKDRENLFDAQALVASGDQVDLYVIAQDALVHFRRDPVTGLPTSKDTYRDGEGGVDGLFGGRSLALSPDGTSLYAGTARGLLVFSRDPATGALTFDGLLAAEVISAVAVSPDGAHVYAAEYAWDRVAVLERDPSTGALSLVEVQEDGVAGVSGIAGPRGLAISPDGSHLYAAGEWSDAVAIFARNATTGVLTFLSALEDGQPGTAGLTEPRSVVLSEDGAFAYVTSPWAGMLTAWGRDSSTGTLTLLETWADTDPDLDALARARSFAISSDGLSAFATGEDTLVLFDRDNPTGRLTPTESYRAGEGGIGGLWGDGSVVPIDAYVYRASAGADAVTLLGPLDPAGGSIGGALTAYEEPHPPLKAMRAQAFVWNVGAGAWLPARAAWTDQDGNYTLPGLPADTYRVCFADLNTGRYLPECYDDAPDLESAVDLPLAQGQAQTGVDAQLSARPLTGTVTDAGGAPLADAQVQIQRWIDTEWGGYWDIVRAVTTDANGDFDFGVLPPAVGRVCFIHPDYVQVCRDSVVSHGVLDVQLTTPAAHIPGTVTGPAGSPLQGITVSAISWSDYQVVATTETEVDGTYDLGGLNAGCYSICFSGDDYLDECYDDASNHWYAQAVCVIAGETAEPIDAQLELAGHIAGIVTDSSPVPAPLPDISVQAYVRIEPWSWWNYAGGTSSDSNGEYDLKLPAGTYRVCFYDWNTGDYLNECYDDAGDNVNSATDIAVLAGQTTAGIDAALTLAAHITGTVTDASGASLPGIYVYAYDLDPLYNYWRYLRSATTDANGAYDIGGLPAGTYRVCFYASDYASECYDDAGTDVNSATDIAVLAGETVAGIDAALALAGHITGTVTDASGAPLPGIDVYAYVWEAVGSSWNYLANGYTDASGAYDIGGLPAGTYRVCFDGTGTSATTSTSATTTPATT